MNHTILLVEDNEDDAFFMKQALKDAGVLNPVEQVEDGHQAIEYLSATGAFSSRTRAEPPMVVFLDLKLPYRSGHEVLQWIRQQTDLQKLVVIVLTSSNEQVDIKRSYQLGANSYVVKPPTVQQLLDLAEAFKLWWLRQNRTAPA